MADDEETHHHRAIQFIGRMNWPLVALFYALGLGWLLLRYSGCEAGTAPEWLCDTGAAPSYLIFALMLACLWRVLYGLWALGRLQHGERAPMSVGQIPDQVSAGYRGLATPYQKHIRRTIRGTVYLLGGIAGFLPYWLSEGELIDAGGWVVQLAFIVAAELFLSWVCRGQDADLPPSNDKPPLDGATVLEEERRHIKGAPSSDGAAPGARSMTGLALSGGGIRSATFCLGVLQALAGHRQLRRFDYLSTVSGGSYIGAWLSAWIHRHDKGLDGVEADLGRGQGGKPDELRPPEPAEVNWLRQYSNYLAPRAGLLSADALTLVATWLRNVLLNLAVFVCLLMTLYVSARLALMPAIEAMSHRTAECGYAAAWLGLFIVPLAISFNLTFGRQRTGQGPYWVATTPGVMASVLLPGVIASIFASLSFFSARTVIDANLSGRLMVACVPLALAGICWMLLSLRSEERSPQGTLLSESLIFAIAYLGGLLAAFLLVHLWKETVFAVPPRAADAPIDVEQAIDVLTFGPPLLLLGFALCGSIVVGIVGRIYWERSREWWGRMNAWFFGIGLAWLVFFSLVFYAKPLVDWAMAMGGTWAKSLGLAGWVASLVASLKAPRPAAEKSLLQRMGSRALDLAATVVIAGFLIGTAYGLSVALTTVAGATAQGHRDHGLALKSIERGLDQQGQPRTSTEVYDVQASGAFAPYREAAFRNEAEVLRFQLQLCPNGPGCETLGQILLLPAAFGVMLLSFVLFSWRVDVNKFSLHNMYKNRLIRCYLGASRSDPAKSQHRRPQPFTGFDDDDDPQLHKLQECGSEEAPSGKALRPLHLINTALNITHGTNLAWQERKAASFTFSPLHAGFWLPRRIGDTDDAKQGSYRETKWYASERDEQRHFSLGMALTTSGAALSPNMGQATTRPLAFLMTLFNVRLGRWSPNPVRRKWMQSSPVFGLMCLLQELFGYANEARNFVYLSDGGHFDNTGIYELVRRRCATIVAVDAGADGQRAYGDLANAVRKCRVDFGALIDLDLELLGSDPQTSLASRGHATGTIRYADGTKGTLIVIKPTLVQMLKTQGLDVFGYARRETDFPQQSTADQFFDESQFESYRALGHCIASEAMLTIQANLSH